MKICLFGESPNDTGSIAGLLTKRFPKMQCVTFGGTMPGSHVDHVRRASLALKAKVKKEGNINAVIFIRDLDAPRTDAEAVKNRNEWFRNLSKEFSGTSILLLHIQQSEALLLADIAVVNSKYGVNLKYTKNPEGEANPKKYLKDKTYKGKRKYSENDAAELYSLLDYEKLLKVPYFKAFHTELDSFISPSSNGDMEARNR